MNEREAIEWIHQQLPFGIKPGLTRVNMLLDQLGQPQHKIKTIHIAGTNGKGSTTSFLSHILKEEGYKVGTFTSPYIEQFNERMSINHQPISGDDLISLVERVKPICEDIAQTDVGHPTEFEIITAMAYLYFDEQQVDYAIIEVGLGGRLDSTNVIHPLLSVITSIGFDHTDILGNTLTDIAHEKAGIIKRQTPVISGVMQDEAKREIDRIGHLNDTNVTHLGDSFFVYSTQSTTEGEQFDFDNHDQLLRNLAINMAGHHQMNNAALAVQAYVTLMSIEFKKPNPQIIRNGLKNTHWSGRFETIRQTPDVILDGAHNVEAMESLIETIKQRYSPSSVYILAAFMKHKPVDQLVKKMSQHFEHITLTTFDFSKSCEYYELKEKYENCEVGIIDDWTIAYHRLREQLELNDVLVITGSLYFISEVKRTLSI
ncbi:dihydrofolate synthase/folylpolyglutamate synthase [Alkalibacillus flavidus]|uniref:tetrahydrofolate synthase n=1 Tax=Alkalibacillus flavidus TaxID=546021 RepID=A0ABV2KSL1_9BACI